MAETAEDQSPQLPAVPVVGRLDPSLPMEDGAEIPYAALAPGTPVRVLFPASRHLNAFYGGVVLMWGGRVSVRTAIFHFPLSPSDLIVFRGSHDPPSPFGTDRYGAKLSIPVDLLSLVGSVDVSRVDAGHPARSWPMRFYEEDADAHGAGNHVITGRQAPKVVQTLEMSQETLSESLRLAHEHNACISMSGGSEGGRRCRRRGRRRG